MNGTTRWPALVAGRLRSFPYFLLLVQIEEQLSAGLSASCAPRNSLRCQVEYPLSTITA
jgi:hypothetical protein